MLNALQRGSKDVVQCSAVLTFPANFSLANLVARLQVLPNVSAFTRLLTRLASAVDGVPRGVDDTNRRYLNALLRQSDRMRTMHAPVVVQALCNFLNLVARAKNAQYLVGMRRHRKSVMSSLPSPIWSMIARFVVQADGMEQMDMVYNMPFLPVFGNGSLFGMAAPGSLVAAEDDDEETEDEEEEAPKPKQLSAQSARRTTKPVKDHGNNNN